MEKKGQKYKHRTTQIVLLFGLISVVYACEFFDSRKKNESLIEDLLAPAEGNQSPADSISTLLFRGNYSTIFNDLHDLHIIEAEKLGFSPMKNRSDTSRMKGKIVYYKPGVYENFVVDSLAHSLPVMIPQVASLITQIGENFRDSLRTIDYPDCRIVVTSITRTEEDIKLLRRRNGNAIHESAHRYGTTFDISWLRYNRIDTLDTRVAYDRILKKTLGKVLYDMQQKKKCYIKHEEQQMCFHITVRE